MISAVFVERGGCYFGIAGVDPWALPERDARTYPGPWPVIAHPPCERWGRYFHGSPMKPHQYLLGDDKGCFSVALLFVRWWGGVLEHPAYSKAWDTFGIARPPHTGGWVAADAFGGITCHVEQGHYGHLARKATWLYAKGVQPLELVWGPSPQRLSPIALERYGYEKARRSGVMAYVGGKAKTAIRAATPQRFRDLLIELANSVTPAIDWDPLQ